MSITYWHLIWTANTRFDHEDQPPFTWIKFGFILDIHIYNGNLIWRTVSRRVDEVIPTDPMAWSHPRDVILYARSNYFYNNMFIIYLFLTLFWFYILFWSSIQKNCVNVCHYVVMSYNMTLRHHVFILWLHAWNLLYITSPQKPR